MRTHKIALPALAACLVLGGCWQNTEVVSREEYDALKQDYADLKASSEAARQEYVDQAVAMDDILQELTQVSGRTVLLRSDVEQGRARLTQVEQIEDNIDEIKRKLDRLDKLSAENAQNRKLIASLRKVITEKEAEIEELRKEIQDRDDTISEQTRTITEQSGTIQNQNETISAQQENLRVAVQEQARMLYQAGQDFEELGDESPTVSRRKDKAKVKSLTEEMYEKAILYYTKAQETGYPEAAYRIAEVREKLAQL